jgi:hypothetical protein
MDSVWNKIISVMNDSEYYIPVPIDEIYNAWMDVTYLKICYYNLYEKFLCGGISQEDWDKIYWKCCGDKFF